MRGDPSAKQNINVLEQVLVHEAVIALGVFHREIHVLIHIEGDDILKGDASLLVRIHQSLVHTNRRGSSGESFMSHLSLHTYPERRASPEWD